MPFVPDDEAAFLTASGFDPEAHFIDHEGRVNPLVVRHVDGVPTHVIEDDGTLSPYSPPRTIRFDPVVAEYHPEADEATAGTD